ncbi:MAG: hypothetical protein LYZ69_05345 [Nitrososphaerales archaeon]|nr:hypothetical protein [Nitrososphaerales archaeon]
MVFLIELREQCSQCVAAFGELEEIVKYPPPQDQEGRRSWNRKVWLRVHALLSTSSNVSHIIWPNPLKRRGSVATEKSLKRGRELQAFLRIKDDNPLIARQVRNAFEHIDEQLDDWLPTVPEDIPLGWAISTYPPEDEPEDTKNAFRYVQVNSMDLRVAGATCNLEEIVQWIEGIIQRIPDEAQMIYRKHGEPETN